MPAFYRILPATRSGEACKSGGKERRLRSKILQTVNFPDDFLLFFALLFSICLPSFPVLPVEYGSTKRFFVSIMPPLECTLWAPANRFFSFKQLRKRHCGKHYNRKWAKLSIFFYSFQRFQAWCRQVKLCQLSHFLIFASILLRYRLQLRCASFSRIILRM